MPKIVEETSYNRTENKVKRLGLTGLVDEVREIVVGLRLPVRGQGNLAEEAEIRELVKARFEGRGGWSEGHTGAGCWTKCRVVKKARFCIAVECQFSAPEDLERVDLSRLRQGVIEGQIDVGVLVVPSDRLGGFLTDRAPRFSDVLRHVAQARAEDLPLIVMAVEHDGAGDALAKQAKLAP